MKEPAPKKRLTVAALIRDDLVSPSCVASGDGTVLPKYIPQGGELLWELDEIPADGLGEPDLLSIFAPRLYVAWSPNAGFFGAQSEAKGLVHFPAHFSTEQLRHVIAAAKLPDDYAMVLYLPSRIAGKPRPVEAPPTKALALPNPDPVCGRIHVGSDNGAK